MLTDAQTELEARDYRAIKAFRLGKTVDELYPGETEWYEAQVAKINALRDEIAGRDDGQES
jgi:hypothetical protein